MIAKSYGSYRIIRRLGFGGHTDAILAHDEFGKFVVLKVLRPELSQDTILREKHLSRLRWIIKKGLIHRNIVPILDYGEQDGRIYFIEPFIECRSLCDVLDQRGTVFPPDDVIRTIAPVAAALDYAHARDVLHLDVRPWNIFIGQSPDVYLANWELAEDISTPIEIDYGLLKGTPSDCVSPEVLRGARPLSSASDTFSLAVIVYQLLIGYSPFWSRNIHRSVMNIMNGEIHPPRDLRPDLPIAVERFLYRALASTPGARYQRAGDLVLAFSDSVRGWATSIHTGSVSSEGSTAGPTMRVLFLAADPSNEARLRLGEEVREIQEKLQLSKLRDLFDLRERFSVRPADLSQAMLDFQPRVVHFSGHGDVDGTLCFEDTVGRAQPVQLDALAALFEQFSSDVACVILNACYSELQARAIAQHVAYVIGMRGPIGDGAAVAFSIGFYQALGAGRSFEESYKFGCTQIRLQGIPEHLVPVLVRK